MKKLYSIGLLPLALLLTAGNALPQQTAPSRYISVLSLKVAADKEAALIDFYKTGGGAKTVAARMKDDPKILRWSLLRAVYPGEVAPAANFMISSTMEGAPSEPVPAKRDELYRAASGMNYAEYMLKVRSMSDGVGSVIAHVHDTTPGYAIVEGDYLVLRRLKIAEGKNREVYDLYRNVRLPMATDRQSAGSMKAWSFSHLTFPSGSSLPYDATEVTVYKDLASALEASGGSANAGATSFIKLFPTKSYTNYMDELRSTSKVVRTELYRVMVSYMK